MNISSWWPFGRRSSATANPPEQKKPEYKWPDCAPIDKSDPYWEFNNNMNCNGINYLKKEVEPGRWQWAENEEANRQQLEYEKRKRSLFFALQTRLLTPEEEAEALGHGTSLNIENMVPYREEDKQRELQDAWFQQRRLQMLAIAATVKPKRRRANKAALALARKGGE